MKVIGCNACARERPLLLIPPVTAVVQEPLVRLPAVARPHDKEPHWRRERRRLADGIVQPLQPVVVPLQPPGQRIGDACLPAETDLAVGRTALRVVYPGTHDEVDGTLQRPA